MDRTPDVFCVSRTLKKTPAFLAAQQIHHALSSNVSCDFIDECKGQIDSLEATFDKSALSTHDAQNKASIVLSLRALLAERARGRIEKFVKQERMMNEFGLNGSQRATRKSGFLEHLDNEPKNKTEGEVTMDMSQLATVDPFLLQRSVQVTIVQQKLQELQSLFYKISEMTQAQGEQITRIDDHISDALYNVEAGHNELLLYANSLQASRYLIAKLTLVMAFCVVVFVLFFM